MNVTTEFATIQKQSSKLKVKLLTGTDELLKLHSEI